jgi:hypothetical protein
MNFKSKNTLIILTLALVSFGSGLFIYGSIKEDDKKQQLIEQSIKSPSLPIPEYVIFAGQKVSLKEFDVRERFDRELLTNVYWQSQTILMLKRANRFFPTIEPILKQEGLPDDLKYVALIESGLLNVVSPVGASGFWQFMDKTGKQYGLKINAEVDERYHLEKATYAACKYFKESYAVFNDWGLVAASYNMGIAGLKKQLQSQYGSSYYDLYLNTETSRYVFRILAMKEIAEKPQQYGFYLAKNHLYEPIQTINLSVNYSIPNLASWANEFKTNYKTIKLLNPWLRSSSLTLMQGESVEITLKK